jgi:hypothetical protein
MECSHLHQQRVRILGWARKLNVVLRRVAVAIVRAICWSVLAGVLITLALWLRTSTELRAGFHVATWLALSSALAFVPSLAMELGVAHLLLELGHEQRDKYSPRDS